MRCTRSAFVAAACHLPPPGVSLQVARSGGGGLGHGLPHIGSRKPKLRLPQMGRYFQLHQEIIGNHRKIIKVLFGYF